MRKETYGKLETAMLETGRILGIAGAGGAAGFAIAQDENYLRNAAISASVGVVGLCIRYLGSLAGDCRKALELYENTEGIRKELEEMQRDSYAAEIAGKDIKAAELGALRAEQYMKVERRRQ